jgi:hypothetical protein
METLDNLNSQEEMQIDIQLVERWLDANGIVFDKDAGLSWHGHYIKCDDVQKITLVEFLMQQDQVDGGLIN